MSSGDLLDEPRFPRASTYDPRWLLAGAFGNHPLWLCEWLCEGLPLVPGMRVLDLGCGRAKTSVFLAREFGVEVDAVDLWVDPEANAEQVRRFGLEGRVRCHRGDALDLPFEPGAFDAIVCVDSYSYFGTGDLCLPVLLELLGPGGLLGMAGSGTAKELRAPVPAHLDGFWTTDMWVLHTADWWRAHWERPGLVDVLIADELEQAHELWVRWSRAAGAGPRGLAALSADAGRCLTSVRAIARRRGDGALLPYDVRTGADRSAPR